MSKMLQEEIEECRVAFNRFDRDGSGAIDVSELKATLSIMGQAPSDEDLFLMMSSIDDDGSGEIEFPEFLKIVENQKWLSGSKVASAGIPEDETDTIEAFVALGGNADKTGTISSQKLSTIIKTDFELEIDIDKLIAETDTDNSGEIDYEELKVMLKSNQDALWSFDSNFRKKKVFK